MRLAFFLVAAASPLVAQAGGRCMAEPFGEGELRAMFFSSHADHYLVAFPVSADWQWRCSAKQPLSASSEDLGILVSVNRYHPPAGAPALDDVQYLQEIGTNIARHMTVSDRAVITDVEGGPVMVYRIPAPGGMSQWNLWATRRDWRGDYLDLHVTWIGPDAGGLASFLPWLTVYRIEPPGK